MSTYESFRQASMTCSLVAILLVLIARIRSPMQSEYEKCAFFWSILTAIGMGVLNLVISVIIKLTP